jgi:3-deoxy-manno-octulosonate cytidylyltransferase (CMP-KDO synthetase)
MKSAIVIPARLNSTRLPNKLLLRETGKSLLEHTCLAAAQSHKADTVIVGVDDRALQQEVESFGGNVQMTAADHECGTDRVAEVASRLAGYDIIVNVQGDEPEIPGTAIDHAIELLEQNPAAQMATLGTPIRRRELLDDPACVKVVFDARGRALYFSRSPIPCPRTWDDNLLELDPPVFFQHVGLYAYRRDFLLQIPALPKSQLESVEMLEQLRVLSSGGTIWVGIISHPIKGIDTIEDYRAFVRRCQN